MTIRRVCSSCFEDTDLRRWIRETEGRRGCDACGGFDSPTAALSDVCRHIEICLRKFWGFAVDQLPYESAEGGYQGETWMTGEVLFDEQELSLPRDRGDRLYHAMLASLTDETWCHWDWASLSEDEALRMSWERFCEIVKHRRRFFFHAVGGTSEDRESYSAEAILRAIATLSEQLGLVGELPRDTLLWRAREIPKGKRVCASDFGPPPKQYALQTNRMNPPGIPMMYAASTARTAKLETHAASARIGQWKTLRPARILDLRQPPNIPGIFSDATRHETLGMSFLWDFRADIMRPVARDERAHIDYLPSQVVTEYLRDFEFEGGALDGIAYGSTVDSRGWNVALFVEPEDLGLPGNDEGEGRDPWLTFSHAIRA